MKKNVLFLIVVICVSIFSTKVMAQGNNYIDVVYLRNGSIIKGVIIENTPDVEIKIKTSDGSVFVYKNSEVLKMAKEQNMNSTINKKHQETQSSSVKTYRSPTSAFLWSLLIPGGGQFYNKQYGKGVLMLGVDLAAIGIAIIGATHTSYQSGYYVQGNYVPGYYIGNYWVSGYTSLGYNTPGYTTTDPSALLYVGLGVQFVNAIWSMIDASSSAKKINRQNGLNLSYKLNNNTDLILQPDYKLDRFGGQLSAVLGAKVSLSIH